jgi:anti-sigma B factor antagonist
MSSNVPSPRSRAELIAGLGAFDLRSQRDGDVHVVAPSGELDLTTSPALELELRRVESTDAREIRLDLSDLRFIDSSGIQLLVAAERRSRWDSGRLVLTRPPEPVHRVLRMAGVDERLPFGDDRPRG